MSNHIFDLIAGPVGTVAMIGWALRMSVR